MKRWFIALMILTVVIPCFAGDNWQWVRAPFGFAATNSQTLVTLSNLRGRVDRVDIDVTTGGTNTLTIARASGNGVTETVLTASITGDATYRPLYASHDANGSLVETNAAMHLYQENLTFTITNVNLVAHTGTVYVLMQQE